MIMRILTAFLLLLTTVAVMGCERTNRESRKTESFSLNESAKVTAEQNQAAASRGNMPSSFSLAPRPRSARTDPAEAEARSSHGGGGGGLTDSVEKETISLASMSTVYAATEAIDRKIIRNAELILETDSPTEGLRKIAAAAEANGGFVVTSEFKQNPVTAGAKPTQSVTVVARVPASQFASALEQIRNAGDRVVSEKVSGQDVSEEYLDLEAHLRNKKALEAQFLDIMKQARKVQDALDVQSQLADVRTEIERLEGRRRFLENQSALSTITTTLQMPPPIVATTTSGFGTTITHAFGDAVDTAASIVLFVIQAVVVLVPIAVFFGLPAWLVWRVVRRRVFVRKAEPSPIPSK